MSSLAARLRFLVLLSATILLAGCGRDRSVGETTTEAATKAAAETPKARFVRQIPWIDQGQWLKVDTHVHTKFSDGGYPLLAVVEAARRHGCDAIAITDHSDRNLSAATPEYFEEIQKARQQIPEILVIAGIEWNIPPYEGDEHVTMLMHPDDETKLAEFRERFDDYKKPDNEPIDLTKAFNWLAQETRHQPVMFLNHPSRKRESTESIIKDLSTWQRQCEFFRGFCGAPGHQAADPIGAYKQTISTIDRWDPAAHLVGDAWDRLLGQGHDVWAALAPSDFHSEQLGDLWPGDFSETWVYAKERNGPAVLEALHSGCFFANHGGIARQVELLIHHEDLQRAARPGECIEIKPGTIDISIRFSTPEKDLHGEPNRVDELELIATTAQESKVIATTEPEETGETALVRGYRTGEETVFRARGRRRVDGQPDLLFVTNPIRVIVADRSVDRIAQ